MPDLTPLSSHESTHRIHGLEVRSDEHSDAINAMATRLAVGDEILKTITGQLVTIEGHIKWVTRIVLTAVLAAILALVVKSGVESLPAHSLPGTALPSSPAASP